MRELYIEGLAIHDGPESCVGVREGGGEALTGVRAGRAIEPRNHGDPGCRRCLNERKATSPAALSRAAGGPRAVGEPGHVRNLHAREPGGPDARPSGSIAGSGRSGNAEAASLRCTSAGSRTAP